MDSKLKRVMGFTKAYIKSMRLYYAFVTGIAGWVGVSFYDFKVNGDVSSERLMIILVMLFLSWGINQIINDYLGLEEDKINAPNRPMVTGELNPKYALLVTAFFLSVMIFISWLLNPWSIIPAVLGISLNVLYEYAKAWGLAGNIVFGVMISMCTAYGFFGVWPASESIFYQ